MIPAKTTVQVRQKVAQVLADLPVWTESSFAYDLFQVGGDASSFEDQSFCVGIPSTQFTDPRIESSIRKRGVDGGVAVSTVRVRWFYRLPPGMTVSSYDGALAAEADLLHAVLALQSTDFEVWCTGMDRRVNGAASESWVVGDLAFAVSHRISIT